MDADDYARIIEGVAAVLDLLAADGDAVDDPAPIYELLAERCRHVRVALEVMMGAVACVPDRGRSLARGRVSNVSVRADPIPPGSGGRASRRGGAWPSVSAASVSARFPSLSGQCSGRCVAT